MEPSVSDILLYLHYWKYQQLRHQTTKTAIHPWAISAIVVSATHISVTVWTSKHNFRDIELKFRIYS